MIEKNNEVGRKRISVLCLFVQLFAGDTGV